MPMLWTSVCVSSSQSSMCDEATRISCGPLRVPGTYDVVRSSGIGRMTTRARAKSVVVGVVPPNSPTSIWSYSNGRLIHYLEALVGNGLAVGRHRNLRGIGGQFSPALRFFEARSGRAAEVRHVGHDLQRVPVSADLVAVELGLDGGLVDEVLRRAAAEHDRRGPRPPDHQVRRFDDVADDVDVAGAGFLLARLREAHADRRIRNRRTENRHVGPEGGRQDAVPAGRLPEVA